MCMIACGLTREYGVLASDSAMYDYGDKSIRYQSPKTSIVNGKYLMAFLGTNLYFSTIDWSKFDLPLRNLSLYLQDHFQRTRKNVKEIIKKTTEDKDEQEPNFCVYIIGLHNGKPTLATFNSFKDFRSTFMWSDDELKIATLYHGDDSDKNRIFKEATDYMKDFAKTLPSMEVSPGILGEILTRGIYHKADLELEIGDKRKYAGGAVNVGCITDAGITSPLSGLEVINGSR